MRAVGGVTRAHRRNVMPIKPRQIQVIPSHPSLQRRKHHSIQRQPFPQAVFARSANQNARRRERKQRGNNTATSPFGLPPPRHAAYGACADFAGGALHALDEKVADAHRVLGLRHCAARRTRCLHSFLLRFLLLFRFASFDLGAFGVRALLLLLALRVPSLPTLAFCLRLRACGAPGMRPLDVDFFSSTLVRILLYI